MAGHDFAPLQKDVVSVTQWEVVIGQWLINVLKLHILKCPLIATSPKHTCAIITLSNQHP